MATLASDGLVALTGMRVNAFAQQALGLTEDQAEALFGSDNNLRALERMVAALSEGTRKGLPGAVPHTAG